MASTAPWWATGVFTLGGVVIAQLVAWVLNRSRATFEDSRRWHEDRRDIYLDVVINAWRIQNAVFDHFEQDVPLPDGLEAYERDLGAAGMKTKLIGSEAVKEVTDRLVIEGGHAVTCALRKGSGQAVDACDNLRHTLYYLTDLMRAELTSDRAAVAARGTAGRVARERRAAECPTA